MTTSPLFPPSDDRCPHKKQEIRRRTRSNGTMAFVMQCLGCGHEMRTVAKTDPLRTALIAPPPEWDSTISERYYKDRTDRWKQEAENRKLERQRDYERYLNSVEWRERSTRRLMVDQHQCQARLSGCLRTATQVHHLSYTHLGNEPLFDLISVCRTCHEQITEMDRSRRGVAA